MKRNPFMKRNPLIHLGLGSKQLMETLKSLQVGRMKEVIIKGWKHIPDRVLVNEVGQMVDGDNLWRRLFYPALAKAGLSGGPGPCPGTTAGPGWGDSSKNPIKQNL